MWHNKPRHVSFSCGKRSSCPLWRQGKQTPPILTTSVTLEKLYTILYNVCELVRVKVQQKQKWSWDKQQGATLSKTTFAVSISACNLFFLTVILKVNMPIYINGSYFRGTGNNPTFLYVFSYVIFWYFSFQEIGIIP